MIKPDKIVYSKRKTFSIQIDEEGELTVRAPEDANMNEILDILSEKRSWIVKKKKEAKKKQKREYTFTPGEYYFFLGKTYPLRYDINSGKALSFDGESFITSSDNPEVIKRQFERWYKDKAKKIIVHITAKYSEQISEKYKKVKLSSAKTRWGSCSNKKNINISWRLVLAPLPVLDYVIAHEVAHLKYMDHSKRFWKLVYQMVPEYEKYKAWLKDNGHLLSF